MVFEVDTNAGKYIVKAPNIIMAVSVVMNKYPRENVEQVSRTEYANAFIADENYELQQNNLDQ